LAGFYSLFSGKKKVLNCSACVYVLGVNTTKIINS